MKILTKPEELLLLAVCNLKDKAYGVEMLKFLSEKTGFEWSIGSIYIPLDRLARMGYVDTYQGDPSAERGGKSKRFYRITEMGLKALTESRKVNEDLWSGISEFAVDK
ncbi:MAG: PadR family transcriptional regulator [bacterium]|nr:PadR family transcriptional regulator [bacterium]